MASQLSFVSSMSQQLGNDEHGDDFIKKSGQRRNSPEFKDHSPNHSGFSPEFLSLKPSPLHTENLSPVRPQMNESAFASNINFFNPSPSKYNSQDNIRDADNSRTYKLESPAILSTVSNLSPLTGANILSEKNNAKEPRSHSGKKITEFEGRGNRKDESPHDRKQAGVNTKASPNVKLFNPIVEWSPQLGFPFSAKKITASKLDNENMNLPLQMNSSTKKHNRVTSIQLQKIENENHTLNLEELSYRDASDLLRRPFMPQKPATKSATSQGFDALMTCTSLDNIISGYKGIVPNGIDYETDISEQIIKFLRKLREKFVDRIFVPTLNSLVNSIKNNSKPEWLSYEWRRISELYRGSKIVLYDQISPVSIDTGINQCPGLMTAIAVAAENADLIKNIMYNQVYNEEGCYGVKICKDGIWRHIVVDDYIPCYREKNSLEFIPAFANCPTHKKKHEIWPHILEKAWAKSFHTYENLKTVDPSQILRDLTGAPCQDFLTIDPNLWTILSDALSQGNLIYAHFKLKSDIKEAITEIGFNPDYGYSVLDTLFVKTGNGDIKLIKMRDIWPGTKEWEGEWGYNSQKWTNKLKEDLDLQGAIEEKIIFFTMNEFKNVFSDITICKYQQNNEYSHIVLKHLRYTHSIGKFTIEKPTEITIELTQLDTHLYRNNNEYRYSPCRIILARIDPDDLLAYISGSYSSSKYNHISKVLSEGSYLAFINMDWVGKPYDVTLSLYSETKIELHRQSFKENAYLLPDLFKQYTVNSLSSLSVDNDSNFRKYDLIFDELKMNVEVYKNNSKDKPMFVKKKVPSNPLNHSPTAGSIDFVVIPGESEVVLLCQ